jgi:hypothetical protein
MQGFITLHRSIQDHWIGKEKRQYSKFEAWVDILLMANYQDNKFVLGNTTMVVKRWSFITSEIKMMDKWGWSKSKLRAFLKLLKDEQMIISIVDSKKTTITIVKYDDYQYSETKEKPKKNQRKTDKELRSDTNNNGNKENNLPPLSPDLDFSKFDSSDIKKYWQEWIQYRESQKINSFKTIKTEQIAINSLSKLSSGSSEISWLIIEQSISAGYTGLFKLKYKPSTLQTATASNNYWSSIITSQMGSPEYNRQIVEAFKDRPDHEIPHEFKEVFHVYRQILQ